jgi:hypothetical protein
LKLVLTTERRIRAAVVSHTSRRKPPFVFQPGALTFIKRPDHASPTYYWLVLAGAFVFTPGTLLTGGVLVSPPALMLAFVEDTPVESLGVLWSQPTSATMARTVIANRGTIDFIILFSYCHRR